MGGRGLVGEPEAKQGFIQPIATAVTGKDSSGSIPAMSRRSQSHHVELGMRVTKPWNGASPIVPFLKSFDLGGGDFSAVGGQSRTLRAIGNVPVQDVEAAHLEHHLIIEKPTDVTGTGRSMIIVVSPVLDR